MAYRDPTHQLAAYIRDQKRLRNMILGQIDAVKKTLLSIQKIGPVHVGLIAMEKFIAFTGEFLMRLRCLMRVVKCEPAKFHTNRH